MSHETKEAALPDEYRRALEAFKEANDQRLAALEKGRPDPLLGEKVDRIERALGAFEAAAQRAEVAARRPEFAIEGAAPLQKKSAWSAYLRRGDESQLGDLELKALSVGSPSDGGYVAPPDIDKMITDRLVESSPMRQIATVRTTGSSTFRRVVSTSAAGAGWVGETAARPQGATPSLAVVDAPTAELFANLAATQTLLDDAFVNVEEWLAAECEQAFAAQERAAFVSGDGNGKPKGFLACPTAVDAPLTAWGTIGYLATGVAGAFAATAPTDRLLDLVFAPRAQFRQNGRFVMNRRTLAAVRKLKDSANSYIWQPRDAAGTSTVLGYPVTEIEDMPNIAADAFAIAFGDFQAGYLIVDRVGVRVLRDPYSAKPYVLFYVTKRVGGVVQNTDAIKLLKFGVS